MTRKIADPLLTTGPGTGSSAWFSFKPNQTNPDSNTSRENDTFSTPYHALLNCSANPLFQTSLCRPLRALALNILLMEGK